jgi:4-hydroxybenzoate polyprenyltransferase
VIGAFFVALRPRQWTKNLLVFAGLLFSRGLFDLASVGRATLAFLLFCLLSGGIYLVNDVVDAERDRNHPQKRHRPVASGRLPRPAALVMGVVLLIGASLASFAISVPFGAVAVA